jgi:hypothetical protein
MVSYYHPLPKFRSTSGQWEIGTQHVHPKRAGLGCGKSGPPIHYSEGPPHSVEEATGVAHCSHSALDWTAAFVICLPNPFFEICEYVDFLLQT